MEILSSIILLKDKTKMSLKGDIEEVFRKNTGYAEPEHAINLDIMLKLTPPLDILTPLTRLFSVQLMT